MRKGADVDDGRSIAIETKNECHVFRVRDKRKLSKRNRCTSNREYAQFDSEVNSDKFPINDSQFSSSSIRR